MIGFFKDDDAGLESSRFDDRPLAATGLDAASAPFFETAPVAAFFLAAVVVVFPLSAAGRADFFAADAARVVFFLGPDFGLVADLLRVDVFFTADFFARKPDFGLDVFDAVFFVERPPREPVFEAFLATFGALLRG